MFMIVTYPWPVPSAHVQLTGRAKKPGKAPARHDEHPDDAPQPALAGAGQTR
jgi:hypothetical protein